MKAPFFLLMWGLATYVVYLLAASVIQGKISQIRDMELVSSAILNQVAQDWTTLPFVDITVIDIATDGHSCPAAYPDVVMERVFYGTKPACDCRGVTGFGMRGMDEFNVNEICSEK